MVQILICFAETQYQMQRRLLHCKNSMNSLSFCNGSLMQVVQIILSAFLPQFAHNVLFFSCDRAPKFSIIFCSSLILLSCSLILSPWCLFLSCSSSILSSSCFIFSTCNSTDELVDLVEGILQFLLWKKLDKKLNQRRAKTKIDCIEFNRRDAFADIENSEFSIQQYDCVLYSICLIFFFRRTLA